LTSINNHSTAPGNSTIVIDCGKTWHERIALVFPENGLRKIDGEQAIQYTRSAC
jgi:hypothetical protein